MLYAGPGAALSGISALWWMGLVERRPDQIHLVAPGRRSSRDGLRVTHPRTEHRRLLRGLPVVLLPEALLSSAGFLGHDSLRLVLARAEFRRLLSLSSLIESTGRGRAGSRALRAAMSAHLPPLTACKSPLEIDFVLLCERFRLPLPEPNARIGRRRPDMLWGEARLIVELDGKDAHHTPAQLIADEHRAADLRRRGFTVIRFRWEEIQFEQEAVAADLKSRLAI